MVFTGDVSAEEIYTLADEYFAGISAQEPPAAVRTVEPKQQGERRIRIEAPAQTPLLHMVFHAYSAKDPETLHLNLLLNILVGGDSLCAAISIASIIAKYLRELLMARLNRYFCSRLAGLEPTEGYFRDGNRFVAETTELRGELGIADSDFLRAR